MRESRATCRFERSTRTAAASALLVVLTGLPACVPPAKPDLSAWIVGGARRIEPDSRPLYESEIYSADRGRVRLVAAIQETAAFQIALRSEQIPAGPFDISITDFKGPSGTLASRAAATIYRVQEVPVADYGAWYPEHTGRRAAPRSAPELLIPWEAPRGGGPIRLGRTRNETIWVDIFVPPTTEPGEYTARLELRDTTTDTVGFACDVSLRVVPVVLPGERTLPIIARIDPRDLLAEQLQWPRAPAEETRIIPGVPTHQAAQRLVNATMRLFHEHRLTPVLWASFPKYRATGPRSVTIDWTAYDALVGPWLDGSAFADRAAVAVWPVPISIHYPDAVRNGGFSSARYARLVAAYLAACERHFEQRGWDDRALVRMIPPEALTQGSVDRVARLASIVEQSEIRIPLAAHLPARTLQIFGWYDAPKIDLPDVDIWAPPAGWYDTAAMLRERELGRETWFMPDRPPYSASLAVAAPASDATMLAWQAFRYGARGIWLEHAADRASDVSEPAPLVYPGTRFGLVDRPVPSIRLKRLRRGQLDYELLRMLERRGKPLLAQRAAAQLVRWAFTDACAENLLRTRRGGWLDDAQMLSLARDLIRQELANEFAPSDAGSERQQRNLADWARMLSQTTRIDARVTGVRLGSDPADLKAYVFTSVSNATDGAVAGTWRFPNLPFGWTVDAVRGAQIAPNGHTSVEAALSLGSIAFNADGIYPFEAVFETDTGAAARAIARLAVASCPLVEVSPVVDGDLSDWIKATNNAAGDFRLVRGGDATDASGAFDFPTHATRAFFCMDREHLYVAVYCPIQRGERPSWRADNVIPLDGAVPWGQDLVEVLLDPRNTRSGTAAGIYTLQIKPSGLLVAREGARSDPPMNASKHWDSGVRVAVDVSADAWTVELAVPLAALGDAARRNRVWGVNVTRLDARRGEYSSWSGAKGTCYAPELLGNLVLLRP